jgi:hippurate hydrolase
MTPAEIKVLDMLKRNKSKGITSNVHTPTFNIDEAAIEHGMGMMAWLATKV